MEKQVIKSNFAVVTLHTNSLDILLHHREKDLKIDPYTTRMAYLKDATIEIAGNVLYAKGKLILFEDTKGIKKWLTEEEVKSIRSEYIEKARKPSSLLKRILGKADKTEFPFVQGKYQINKFGDWDATSTNWFFRDMRAYELRAPKEEPKQEITQSEK